MKRVWATSFGAVAALACATTMTFAGAHPRYLHARTDLRVCQWYLRQGSEERNVARHLQWAQDEVEAAIHEIDHAAVLDNKDLDDHPRTDAILDRPGRFRKMVALLKSARSDISMEEDNPSAVGWRDLAYKHIDKALENVRKAAVDLQIDHDLAW